MIPTDVGARRYFGFSLDVMVAEGLGYCINEGLGYCINEVHPESSQRNTAFKIPAEGKAHGGHVLYHMTLTLSQHS